MFSPNPHRVKLDARKIDSLIRLGMAKFDAAGIYVAPAKMSKLVRESARQFGYALTEVIVAEYFEASAAIEWESYQRALRSRSLTSIRHHHYYERKAASAGTETASDPSKGTNHD